MNAMTLLRDTEIMGAKEFRARLDHTLRHLARPCRVMLHNKPALAVLPDDEYLGILELLEELKDEGILDRVTKKLDAEHKKRHSWFWTKTWQAKEKRANREIKAGKINRAHSAEELIKQFNS